MEVKGQKIVQSLVLREVNRSNVTQLTRDIRAAQHTAQVGQQRRYRGATARGHAQQRRQRSMGAMNPHSVGDMANKRSTGTPATAVLERAGVTHVLHTYPHDPRASSFGLEAAAALDVAAERVYKTLLVDTGNGLAVGVVPVTCSLDVKALAAALGVKKAVMADPVAAERSSGMVVGGISPLGQKRALPTVLDVTMLDHDIVLVSGGRRGLDIELAPADLARLVDASFGPISRA